MGVRSGQDMVAVGLEVGHGGSAYPDPLEATQPPSGLERVEQALPSSTFNRQKHFTQLPAVMARSAEVVMAQHEWHYHVRLRQCLTIGLEQLFFDLGLRAESLEVVAFIRSVLSSSEADLLAWHDDPFGSRLIFAGIDADVPPMSARTQVIPHVLEINHGFESRALSTESRMAKDF